MKVTKEQLISTVQLMGLFFAGNMLKKKKFILMNLLHLNLTHCRYQQGMSRFI